MLLTEMIDRVHRALGDRARDIDDNEITSYINTVWQFQVPDIIPGFFREEVFTLQFTAGVKVYNLDTHSAFGGRCRSTTHEFYYADGTFLKYFTDQRAFYSMFAPNDFNQALPSTVLSHERELTFGPTPNSNDTVYVSAIAYQAALTADGLNNDNHAFMVLRGAIRDLAGDLGYEEIFQRFAGLFDQSVRRVSAQALSRPTGTIKRTRDF